MIHTKELRYGNKVLNRNGDVITVQQILCNTLVYYSQIEVNRELVIAKGPYQNEYFTEMNEVIKEVDYNEVQPISITPEILKKCGFRNFLREEWIISIGCSHIDFEFNNDGLKFRSPAPSLVSIKYLHQLQNFLYAISTHELDIEL